MHLSHNNFLTQCSIYTAAFGLSLGIVSPTFAADNITLHIKGKPLVVTTSQLEDYSVTGNIFSLPPAVVEEYFELPPEDREALRKLPAQLKRSISIRPGEQPDPNEQEGLDLFVPLNQQEQQQAIELIVEKGNGQILLDFLKALPVETLTQDNFVSVLTSYIPVPVPEKKATQNLLYLNSTRGAGTGSYGFYRSAIAKSLDNYLDGTVFDVDFVQTHVTGDLASWLNSKPAGYYNQIWFDTTLSNTSLLNETDLEALNAWAAYKQPEFILDSAFFFRNHTNSTTLTPSAAAVTANQALALRDAGGGIFIGTDHNAFAYTANQVLSNFGFDGLFTGVYNITANASFNHPILLEPETVGSDFFGNHLRRLSTTNVPVGTHTLNENGDNRMIEIFEVLYSLSPGKVIHIGASFQPKSKSVPEPASLVGLLGLGAFGAVSLLKRNR